MPHTDLPWWQRFHVWLTLVASLAAGAALALWRVADLDHGLDWSGVLSEAMRRRWLLPAGVLGLCCWLGLLTWRRVRRLGERPETRPIYRYGIAAFAPAWGTVMVVLRSVDQVRALAPGGQPTWMLVAEVVLHEAVIAFPLALWAGYVVGRVLLYFFDRLGVPRS
jgi:hypothetical protein